MKISLPVKYALIGASIVPILGRAALTGTGHAGDLYRYSAPLLVGAVAGFLLGLSRQRLLDKISELAAARDRLRLQEEKYRQIYNAPGEAVVIYSTKDQKFLETNQAMLDMFGYTAEETGNLTINDISEGVYPYNQRGALNLVRRALDRGTHTFEWRSRKKDGTIFWTEISLKKARFHDQDFLIAVMRDIDQRKKIALELQEEREQLRVTLRSIGDGVITSDTDGRVVLLNKVAEELTGWTQEEAMGRPVEKVFYIINELTGEASENPVRKVLRLGHIIGLANHTALVARDGTTRSIADSGAPIRNNDGEIIGTVLVFRDVTEELAMERELLKTRKLESLGILAGGIAHDFNNILMALSGNISLARAGLDPQAREARLLLRAEKAVGRAANLTRQLLTFSRGGKPVKEVSRLDTIIRESADFVLHGSTVTCSHALDPELWPVSVDPGQIGQVIQNLVLNARQAMPEGGTVAIRAENVEDIARETHLSLPAGSYVRIRVSDSGQGIAGENLEKIFDPYFTTRDKGTGLGLAICHSVINRHNGVITVDSTPGRGTTFTIYLPALPGAEVSATTEEKTAPRGEGTVLIMDDDAMVREITLQMLNWLGYTGIGTKDGNEAVEQYRQCLENNQPVQAVILDLTIAGGMGGREAGEQILAMDPAARLIVASGYSNDPIMADYAHHGFKAVMNKPFNIGELAAVLARVTAGEDS